MSRAGRSSGAFRSVPSRGAALDPPGETVLGPSDRIWFFACGVLTTLFAAILSSVVFGRIPHVQDSVSQLFQARIFAGGHLYAISPPLKEFFDYTHMINDGRWYSQYPPGHSLLLVPGVWLGIPWLINPILAGIGVAATGFLAFHLFGRWVSRLTALLGLLSPFLILMASEFMSHVSGFALLSLFLLFYFRAQENSDRHSSVHVVGAVRASTSPVSTILAAACLALAVLVRPYTALAMSAPVFLHASWRLYKGQAKAQATLLILVAGGAVGTVLLGSYQWGTTGSPFVPGYIQLYGPSHGLGFGKGTWGPSHTLVRGLLGAGNSLGELNRRLFAWPLSSLWPVVAALLPRWRILGPSARVKDERWLLLSFPLSLLAAYVFYWYRDLCFGPRYVYEALGPLLILSAVGLQRMGVLLARIILPRAQGMRRAGPGTVLGALLFAHAFVLVWPGYFRLPEKAEGAPPESPLRQASYFQRYSPEYWGVSPYFGRLVRETGLTHALVFVRFTEPDIDFLPMRHLWFGSAFALEEPNPAEAKVIFAHDLGERNKQLINAYPGREVYLYSGSIEHGELRRMRGDAFTP